MIHPVVGGGGLAYLKPIEGLSTKAKKRYPRRGSTKSAKGKREPRRGRKDREEPPPPHQPSPGGSASATPPQGGSDPEEQTGNILYTINREHGLHLAKVSGKEDCAGLNITPPLRGSRREGGARSRAGGGQTPRSVSDYQRRVGSVVLGTLIQSGGDGRGRARLCAGGTPALPGDAAPSYGAGACLNNGSRCVLQRFGRVWRRRRGFLALQPRAHVKWLPPVR